jgi:hypothetical protein
MPEALSLSESLNDYYYKTALYESKGTALTMAADYDNARKVLVTRWQQVIL